jgi:hypothetical protein
MRDIVKGSELQITGKKIGEHGLPNNRVPDTKSWAVTLEQDPETGELILPFPVDLLSQMGWSEGTEIFWDVRDDKSVFLTEKKPEGSTEEEKPQGT